MKKVGKVYGYSDLDYKEGWADVNYCLPGEFDMLKLRLDSGRTIAGWYTGITFDGLKLQDCDTVLYWKKEEF